MIRLTMPRHLPSYRVLRNFSITSILLLVFGLVLRLYSHLTALPSSSLNPSSLSAPLRWTTEDQGLGMEDMISYFKRTQVSPAYTENFAEMGQRARILRECLRIIDAMLPSAERQSQLELVENAALRDFPFLNRPGLDMSSTTPLTDLRTSYDNGSKGIVIPTGVKTLRSTFHLVITLREVLKSDMPIQIVYAGNEDLHEFQRLLLGSRFDGLEFLDITTLLDVDSLELDGARSAIKPFAALASTFEQVVLLDADAVFLQPPDVLLEQRAYRDNGLLLFCDNLDQRHTSSDWHNRWMSQTYHPRDYLRRFLPQTNRSPKECDSGVVVIDKSRPDNLVGLLHVAWQSTASVRDETLRRNPYAAKQRWWLGYEVPSWTPSLDRQSGVIIGWLHNKTIGRLSRVCSAFSGHVDEDGTPLWYHGGLVKLMSDRTTYEAPTHWMIHGSWETSTDRTGVDCMVGNNAEVLPSEETAILFISIAKAQQVDLEFGLR
ncbi:mannosyltransferase putative-domain-containing protein [Xylariales sp. AK1849]|nr:mannosyltransferase putative-domain-containing protein [Xylariales sp. AK1849]